MDSSKFIRIYANLPSKLREQIVVIIDDKPMTWNAAFIEIDNKTDLGRKILKKLEKMGII
ncbi:hypothetical protein FWF48_04055 [Candidatus Saccharibacteria bacterium]|nr:hypothetical protein [Candidatus Saccharibacteria bacterium]